ncbi:glycosyl transferase [candidate division WWE3 bacterium CG10_big_fil_rev_8_21_14_0_10_32_10]|uniref:dolichyl-phosphate beta-glucosyltransferase n=1 Tax=candidate division WWE3 bacterium CG10_big_fil_rev_8_21_14_0_10_32_10 TaxID=1975090 RepID=A0A2H0RAK6_UNCKA|nr:MAG: glycosyl transferase [candidate division WWE3 bacterium CG10_big_fil_rev_8_21_14_0_10_32_10]
MENTKKVGKPFLSVIIPAYNEEKNILDTLKNVENFLDKEDYAYEILVMDDGSSDSTYSIANNYSSTNKCIKVFNLPHRGKANTVIDGFKQAKGTYILFTDADSATPISEVKKLLHYVTEQGFDVCIASREGVGAVRKNEPWLRHFMGRVFNTLIRFLLLPGIEDTQCGFKLFTNISAKNIISKMKLYDSAEEINVPKVTAFDVELLFVAIKLRYKVKSVPVEWQYGEDSKVSNLRDSLNNFLDVAKVWWNNKKGLYD